ncbi:response regulator transcription factor [Negativibacillus massiliensis]|jgi:two-component system alkaline phosphatase synthesis response regulator PhoP|uniref:response regulator transcription factor n=1 Tax=Negativibacillus massiliensis TaxID=1871035 RepID=UPI002A837D36|nr:response regulator transcription factor [Negativibacillus massiliensis]MDY4047113.1 response regulator transcription factor [Negativibacillus massiliensis]
MIYVLEDDESIRELIIYTLNGQNMQAKGFGTPSEFWDAVHEKTPSLVLLDIMLPEEDGFSILQKLRAAPATKRLPVIMLTAKGSEYDIVRGLDIGADDYVPKPFRMMELLSRIRALLRRSGADNDRQEEYRVGNLYVNPVRHEVQVDGKDVVLTLKEFELLNLLISRQGIVFTRAQLLDEIWGYGFDGESRTVDVHVRTLRQKLGEAGNYIETVRGIGYKIGGEKS